MCSKFWRDNSKTIDIAQAKNSFIEDFKYIISLGFMPSHRSHNTGIGKTFEDLIEVEENNLSVADYMGHIELKSQRDYTSSMISLFTKSPSYPPNANTTLRENFGYPDVESGYNIIHTTIKYSKFNNFKNEWGFKLKIDVNKQRLYLLIKELKTNKLQKLSPYWNFDDLNNKIITKCSMIAYITAETKIVDNVENFHFNKAILLTGLTLEKFLEAIKKDLILFDIRIGVYRSGKSKGKSHDHGSGFRTKRRDLSNIFDIEEIEIKESEKFRGVKHNEKKIDDSIRKREEDSSQKKITGFKNF